MLVLTPPVEAPPARPFQYAAPFRANQHRGLDFATTPNTPVQAPCTGTITYTGTLPTGKAVSLRCQSFTVTLLNATGAERHQRHHVHRGTAIARTTEKHLHLGVRHTRDRFGYIDPAPLLRATKRPPAGPPPIVVHRHTTPRAWPRATAPPASPLAPATTWLGLALVLTATAGLRAHRRRRLAPWHARSTSRSSRPTPRRWRRSTSARSAGR